MLLYFFASIDINYFHCKKIIEILKETEADSKNLFGRYGSKRMKDWQDILRLYEKDNLYLAEASQMLIRNINYEIPSFKKQIQKFEQTGHVSNFFFFLIYNLSFLFSLKKIFTNKTFIYQELDKKEAEYKKNENTARIDFQNLCKQLGIPGKKIKRELVDRISELPGIYDRVSKKTKCLENVIDFYSAFVKFVAGRVHDGGCVPMVQYVVEKGNTTTYEWIYNEAPLSLVEPKLNIDLEDDGDSDQLENDAVINLPIFPSPFYLIN